MIRTVSKQNGVSYKFSSDLCPKDFHLVQPKNLDVTIRRSIPQKTDFKSGTNIK